MIDVLISAHIGLPHEPAGIVAVERVETLTGEFDAIRKRWATTCMYRVRRIERPDAGARLTDVADLVEGLVAERGGLAPPDMTNITPAIVPRLTLLVNVTACGRPPVDLLAARGLKPIPIVHTNADAVRRSRGALHVPRPAMVSSLSILMAERRLQAPREAPPAQLLADQLREFRAKPRTPSTAQQWHDEPTGELVMALMLAVWYGARLSSSLKQPPPPRAPIDWGRAPTFDEAFQAGRKQGTLRRERRI